MWLVLRTTSQLLGLSTVRNVLILPRLLLLREIATGKCPISWVIIKGSVDHFGRLTY